jgi:hypothetical protein
VVDIVPRSHTLCADSDGAAVYDLRASSTNFRLSVPTGTAVLLHPRTLRRAGKRLSLGQTPALPVCHWLSFFRVSEPTEPTWNIDHWEEMQDSYRNSPFVNAPLPRDACLQVAWESVYLWMRGEGGAATTLRDSTAGELAETVRSAGQTHRMRVGSAYGLGAAGRAGDDAAIRGLADLVAHSEAEVRHVAVVGAGVAGDDAVPLLVRMVEDCLETRNIPLACDVIAALGEAVETPSPQVIEVLVRAADRSLDEGRGAEQLETAIESLGLVVEKCVAQRGAECVEMAAKALIRWIPAVHTFSGLAMVSAARGMIRLCSEGGPTQGAAVRTIHDHQFVRRPAADVAAAYCSEAVLRLRDAAGADPFDTE